MLKFYPFSPDQYSTAFHEKNSKIIPLMVNSDQT